MGCSHFWPSHPPRPVLTGAGVQAGPTAAGAGGAAHHPRPAGLRGPHGRGGAPLGQVQLWPRDAANHRLHLLPHGCKGQGRKPLGAPAHPHSPTRTHTHTELPSIKLASVASPKAGTALPRRRARLLAKAWACTCIGAKAGEQFQGASSPRSPSCATAGAGQEFQDAWRCAGGRGRVAQRGASCLLGARKLLGPLRAPQLPVPLAEAEWSKRAVHCLGQCPAALLPSQPRPTPWPAPVPLQWALCGKRSGRMATAPRPRLAPLAVSLLAHALAHVLSVRSSARGAAQHCGKPARCAC